MRSGSRLGLLVGAWLLTLHGVLLADDFPPGGTPLTLPAPPRSAPATSPAVVPVEFRSAAAKANGQTDGRQPAAKPIDRDATTEVAKGSSSSSIRKAALSELPLAQLSDDQRAQVAAITENISYFRRLPTIAFAIEPEIYTYFVQNPDVAVSIWRAMKISKLDLTQVDKDHYSGDTHDGTTGEMEVLYRGTEKLLVLCNGWYQSNLITKPIQAKSLLLLQSRFFKEADGSVYVTHRADLFVSFPSQTVEAVAKILSPITVTLTDRTFTEISLFAKMMSLAMARRPDWVEHITTRMEGVSDQRKHQLLVLTAHVFVAAQKKALAAQATEGGTETASETAERRGQSRPGGSPTPSRVVQAEGETPR